jgi:hypothetical protein
MWRAVIERHAPFAGGMVERGLADNGVDYATSGGFVDSLIPELEAPCQDVVDGTIIVPAIP